MMVGKVLFGIVMSAIWCEIAYSQCVPAKHTPIPVITEFDYHSARQMMIQAGWQPLQTKSFNTIDIDPDISSGNGRIFWDKGYVEVEACAGSGVAPCTFLFQDVYGNKLRVTTAGQEFPEEKIYALVTGYQFACDTKQDL